MPGFANIVDFGEDKSAATPQSMHAVEARHSCICAALRQREDNEAVGFA